MRSTLLPFLLLCSICCGHRVQQGPAEVATADAAAQKDCDDPDAGLPCCFVNKTEDLGAVMTIASPSEPGTRIVIRGRILNADTRAPYPNAVLYAYHTDNTGIYSKTGKETGVQRWHGRLHGWCRTDAAGRYEIRTIRPAAYPDGEGPAHIHAAVQLAGGSQHWINDFVFADDPAVGPTYYKLLREPDNPAALDNGVLTMADVDGELVGERDIMIRE